MVYLEVVYFVEKEKRCYKVYEKFCRGEIIDKLFLGRV